MKCRTNSMNRVGLIAACLLFAGGCVSVNEKAGVQRIRAYDVTWVDEGTITIDGLLPSSEWPLHAWETDFVFPWERRKAPRTEFCCVTDGKQAFFAFRCEDVDVVVNGSETKRELAVADGDRVELFFARDLTLDDYHCIEIGPSGRVLDYQASYYRKFNDAWNCPGRVVATTIQETGYVVEFAIPLTTLRELTGLDWTTGCAPRVGVFRAEFSHTKSDKPKEAWISWVRPHTAEPDFHVPSAFGNFRIGSRPVR